MPYGKDDARSALPTASAAPVPDEMADAEYVRLHEPDPDESFPGARIRWARGQNLVLGYGEIDATATVDFDEDEEHMLLLPDAGVSARITTRDETATTPGERVIVLPPGRVSVQMQGRGRFISLVRSTSTLAERAVNASSYATAHPNIPPFRAWPAPPEGYRVRVYDATVPPSAGSTFRIFRCTTMMVNYIDAKNGPRDRSRLSPHAHDDFEQYSLVLDGEYIHHLRWPWGTDANRWRDDDHERIGGPSLTVIPPPSIHTSEAIGEGRNHLVDIFSPPREDFSLMPGWVVNAADYPLPEGVSAP